MLAATPVAIGLSGRPAPRLFFHPDWSAGLSAARPGLRQALLIAAIVALARWWSARWQRRHPQQGWSGRPVRLAGSGRCRSPDLDRGSTGGVGPCIS